MNFPYIGDLEISCTVIFKKFLLVFVVFTKRITTMIAFSYKEQLAFGEEFSLFFFFYEYYFFRCVYSWLPSLRVSAVKFNPIHTGLFLDLFRPGGGGGGGGRIPPALRNFQNI